MNILEQESTRQINAYEHPWKYFKQAACFSKTVLLGESFRRSRSRNNFWKTSKVYFSFEGYWRFKACISPIRRAQAFSVFPHLVRTLLPSSRMDTTGSPFPWTRIMRTSSMKFSWLPSLCYPGGWGEKAILKG